MKQRRVSRVPQPEYISVRSEADDKEEARLLSFLVKSSFRIADVVEDLSALYCRTGRALESVPHLERALDLAETELMRARLLLTLGRVMEHARDYEAAAHFYRLGCDQDSDGDDVHYWLLNNLGFCLNQLGEHGEALEHCQAAIEYDPSRHNAAKNWGVAFEGLGRWADAALAYLVAAEVAPDDGRSLMHLEHLLAAHPEILRDDAEIEERVEECRETRETLRKQMH
ncbi:MAG: tetratricopeptide repeat protein [bacterium]|nr:tetratricopeptide repeat protein [bacterium]